MTNGWLWEECLVVGWRLAGCCSVVSCADLGSSPSLKRSGDPSPKGRFNGRDMGGWFNCS